MDQPRLSLRPTAAVSPLAPFWMRAVAFLIDALVLGAAFQGLWLAAPAVALTISPVAVWIQFGVAWLYFALCNGPLGHGATLGKMALDLRTLRTGGSPLPPAVAARRAALQVAPFLLVLCAGDLVGTRADPLAWTPVVVFTAISYLGLGLLAANTAHLAMSPLGQAWHDRLAGTVTARLPIGSLFDDFIEANSAATDAARRALQFSLFALIAVLGMSSCQLGQHGAQRRDEDVRRLIGLHHRMAEVARFSAGIRPEVGRGLAREAGTDGVTTGALLLYYDARGHAPSEAGVELEAAIGRILDLLNADAETNRALLFARRNEDGAIVHRTDVQLREARAVLEETYRIFNVTTNRRKVRDVTIPLRFPADELVEPALPSTAGPVPAPMPTHLPPPTPTPTPLP